MWKLGVVLLLALGAALSLGKETVSSDGATPRSYWVWNRNAPLAPAELDELRTQNVRELFWHVGEIENRGSGWRWRRAPVDPPVSELHIIPVVRIDPTVREPFSGSALIELLAKLRATVDAHHWTELQIDCDTPDRLLGSYAQALREVHRFVPQLTVTALAGWSRSPHWTALQEAVDEIFPMFYDLDPDPPNVGHGAAPRPLLESESVDAQLRAWSACRIPWRAGLPNFARLTVYDATGKSRGHIRQWRWSDVCFNSSLTSSTPAEAATVLLGVRDKTQLAGTPLVPGESLAARLPERAALAHAIKTANALTARGVIFFRLPDDTDPSGWSLRQLRQLESPVAEAQLVLRASATRTLQLVNESETDLPPRLAGTGGELDRGYALEIDAPAPIWREALPGQFWRVTAHATPETKAVPVPIPLATRLTFWFSHLHAGDQLETGLIQTAPGDRPTAMRYRILNAPGAETWRELH